VAITSAANAGFIISLFAVMVPLIDSIIYRRRPKIGLTGAVVLSVLGTALLTMRGDQIHVNLGNFLVLGAAVCRAIQMTFTKRLTDGKQMDSVPHYNPTRRRCDWIWDCQYVSTPIDCRSYAFILAHYRISCSLCDHVCFLHSTDDDS